MRWSNSKVWLRQLNVQIISARVNENNRWKRNAKKTTKQNKIKNMQTKKKQKHRSRMRNRSYSERVRAKWFCCLFKFSPINM